MIFRRTQKHDPFGRGRILPLSAVVPIVKQDLFGVNGAARSMPVQPLVTKDQVIWVVWNSRIRDSKATGKYWSSRWVSRNPKQIWNNYNSYPQKLRLPVVTNNYKSYEALQVTKICGSDPFFGSIQPRPAQRNLQIESSWSA